MYQLCLSKADRDNDMKGCLNRHTKFTSFTPKLRKVSLPLTPYISAINRIDHYASRVIRFPSLLTAGCKWVPTRASVSAASWAQMRHDDAFVVGRSAEESVEALPEGEAAGRFQSWRRVHFTLCDGRCMSVLVHISEWG